MSIKTIASTLLTLLLLGCNMSNSSLDPMAKDTLPGTDQLHEHEHEHAEISAHKPMHFGDGVMKLHQWTQEVDFESTYGERALEVVRWLPELAIESELPKTQWLEIYQACLELQEKQQRTASDWRSFLEIMNRFRYLPEMNVAIVDERDWH